MPSSARVPAGKLVHAIVDNYATHTHPKVKAWLARHPRWTLLSGAILHDADLVEANLSRAELRRADLRRADLIAANPGTPARPKM
jgi:uncharacterized protein YjbI with pentapeptide repeats